MYDLLKNNIKTYYRFVHMAGNISLKHSPFIYLQSGVPDMGCMCDFQVMHLCSKTLNLQKQMLVWSLLLHKDILKPIFQMYRCSECECGERWYYIGDITWKEFGKFCRPYRGTFCETLNGTVQTHNFGGKNTFFLENLELEVGVGNGFLVTKRGIYVQGIDPSYLQSIIAVPYCWPI